MNIFRNKNMKYNTSEYLQLNEFLKRNSYFLFIVYLVKIYSKVINFQIIYICIYIVRIITNI